MQDGDWVRLTHVELGEHLGKMLTYEREHIDAQVRYVEKLVEHERELRLAEAEARALALSNQAMEYERRLENLNHENARVQALGNEMLTRTEFRAYLKEREGWEGRVNKQLDRYAGALALMAILLTVLSIFLKFVYPW